ncbi:MAG: hypothetical protein ABIG68_02555, partial [Acidobacteriota bacterium]
KGDARMDACTTRTREQPDSSTDSRQQPGPQQHASSPTEPASSPSRVAVVARAGGVSVDLPLPARTPASRRACLAGSPAASWSLLW